MRWADYFIELKLRKIIHNTISNPNIPHNYNQRGMNDLSIDLRINIFFQRIYKVVKIKRRVCSNSLFGPNAIIFFYLQETWELEADESNRTIYTNINFVVKI